jgi:hypothetical protein
MNRQMLKIHRLGHGVVHVDAGNRIANANSNVDLLEVAR